MFDRILTEISLSLTPQDYTDSQFFSLFYGTEWDLYNAIKLDLNEQVEISKTVAKGSLATFNVQSKTRQNISRGDEIVRGGEYTPYPTPRVIGTPQ